MKKTLHIAVVLALAVGMMAAFGAAEDDDSESTDVEVTIAEQTAVDVKPDQLTYSDMEPGMDPTSPSDVPDSDRNFTAVEIENIGSTHIDRIWAETSYPASNPFGTGDAEAYDAGNFIQVRVPDIDAGTNPLVEADQNQFHFVNRIEFLDELDDAPSYIQVDPADFDEQDDTQYVGRIRAGEYEWFFVVNDNNDDQCVQGEVRVGNTPHTPTELGTYDFTDGNNGANDASETNGWTSLSVEELAGASHGAAASRLRLSFADEGATNDGDTDRAYGLLTSCDDNLPHVVANTYNSFWEVSSELGDNMDLTEPEVDTDLEDAVSGVEDILDASTAGEALAPGQSFALDTTVEVPQGVAQGSVEEGTLTILVTSDPAL
ncbi:hypothetical protein QA600_18475 [Natronococcus sp. A-GB1]|uniref:hypothetical protein n=1 Tax=Natronococcus sp. A-GB1 TaxID=3037648 RepID=UPI00241F898C|nr:hypothetical protein [Natronococcus sp. A-GB1]MDG5761319.1 hypothetical protein [Natronococcus sp. A-GB1]